MSKLDCFWCGEVYDAEESERCPNCSSDTDTKAVKIISKSEYRRHAIMNRDAAAASGENGTTSSAQS